MKITSNHHKLWVHDVEIDVYECLGSLWWYDIKWWDSEYRKYVCELSEAKYEDWSVAQADAVARVDDVGFGMDDYIAKAAKENSNEPQ